MKSKLSEIHPEEFPLHVSWALSKKNSGPYDGEVLDMLRTTRLNVKKSPFILLGGSPKNVSCDETESIYHQTITPNSELYCRGTFLAAGGIVLVLFKHKWDKPSLLSRHSVQKGDNYITFSGGIYRLETSIEERLLEFDKENANKFGILEIEKPIGITFDRMTVPNYFERGAGNFNRRYLNLCDMAQNYLNSKTGKFEIITL